MFSMKISKTEKLYVHILSKHNLYQIYCHWFNKYLPSIHEEPSAGNREESKTEKSSCVLESDKQQESQDNQN